jgi:glucose-6-phosphate isomerase
VSDDTSAARAGVSSAVVPAASKRWLGALRRAWATSGALERWVEDRGVTGCVWIPSAYEPDDVAPTLVRLTDAGAKPDRSLLWDLALDDIRQAADELLDVYRTSGTLDGYVAVWSDPQRLNDPEKAVKAAAEIVADVRRANIAFAFAWTPQRAAVLEAFVRNDVPVAVSGVRNQQAIEAIASARTNAMSARREAIAKEDHEREVPEVPVFLLDARDTAPENVFAVELLNEFDLFGETGSRARVPVDPDAESSAWTMALERLAARAKLPAYDDAYTPDAFASAVRVELAELQEDDVLEDVWARDHTVWKDDPTEIADRLGWLDVAARMSSESKDIAEFARRTRKAVDAKHVVLLGMGGSSLGAETLYATLSGGVPFTVLDTTHPDHVAATTSKLDLEHTVFVVGSKSGTTIETRAHLEYFWSLRPHGEQFVAITDRGSELATLAGERGFAKVWENPPDVGGRYSVLTYFGLVPSALAGVDIERVLSSARRAMVANGPGCDALQATGVRLGSAIGEAARKDGRDKLTLVLSPRLASLGPWVEQLIAESTGKEGKGVLPVVGESLGGPEVYGEDRLFVVYTLGDEELPPQIESLEEHAIVRIRVPDARNIGAEIYRWEMATAIVGYLLDINPFDQPDVEAAKVRAREALSASASTPERGDADALLEGIAPPRYVAIQAFIAPDDDSEKRLRAAARTLRDRHRVAVTVGLGPRFLHSTGQYHKGGPDTGVFLQVTDDPTTDVDVPGMGFSFGKLIRAQADGDLLALRDAGRAVARVSLTELESLAR